MAIRFLNLLMLKVTVKDLLGEKTRDSSGALVVTDSSYWSDDELSRLINDSYIEAARLTKGLETVSTVATTESVSEYVLPSTVGQVFRVSYDDRKLPSLSKYELDRTEHNWENQEGYVSHYVSSSMTSKTIRLYKTPTISGGITVSGGEYGVVVGISDGVSTYTFSGEYGGLIETDGVGWTSDFGSEYGVATITGGIENNFEVWATKIPSRMADDFDIPEFPNWCHLGIAYRAAAKALRKYGEHAESERAAAYDLMAQEYLSLVSGFLSQRSTQQIVSLGRRRDQQRVPQPWDQTVEE